MDGLCKFVHHALLNSPVLMQSMHSNADLPDWTAMLSVTKGELSGPVLQNVLTVMASSSSRMTCLADALWCMIRSFTRPMNRAATKKSTDEVETLAKLIPASGFYRSARVVCCSCSSFAFQMVP